jgi:hypothetical protein
MRASLEDWNNGWVEIEVGLTTQDIDRFIALLQMIRVDPEQHFHASSDFVGTGGIGQITFQVQRPNETGNLSLSGQALGAGESIKS